MQRWSFAVVILCLAVQSIPIQAADVDKTKSAVSPMHQFFIDGRPKFLKCGDNPVVIYPGTQDILNNCYRKTWVVDNKVLEPDELSNDKKLCPFVCMARELGLMMANGTLERGRIHAFFEVATPIPSSRTLEIIDLVSACADAHEAATNPENCSSAKPFFKCAFENVFRICGVNLAIFGHLNATDRSQEDKTVPMTVPPKNKKP